MGVKSAWQMSNYGFCLSIRFMAKILLKEYCFIIISSLSVYLVKVPLPIKIDCRCTICLCSYPF